MSDKRLEKLIFKNHEELLEKAILEYICKYSSETYTLEEFYSNGLYIGDAPDLAFVGYIKLSCTLCKNYCYNFNKTYQITFESNISNLDYIKIISVDEEFNIPFKNRLNNDFSRYMEDEDYDKVAKDFLNQYYPEAFYGIGIDSNKVMERMNLNLEYKSISKDGSIFAMIAFEDITIDTYVRKTSSDFFVEKYNVKANTIVIDEKFNYQDSYKDNFTKIHECIHAFKDKKYYFFNKIFNKTSSGIFCNINKYDNDKIRWIEIQTNNITSRILIYKKTLEVKIEEYKKNYRLIDAYDYMNLFDYLRDFFKCSIQALKIRLLNLEYYEFSGIYDYIDDKYIEPYLSSKEIKYYETYSIGLIDVALLALNQNFKKMLATGMYLYVDSHLCLNDIKYITNVDGINHLTKCARNDVSKCCIKFKITYENNFSFSNISFLRAANTIKPKYEFLVDGKYQDEFNIEALRRENESIRKELSELPNDFGDALKKIMKNREVTIEMLASDSDVSEAQIKRLRNNSDQGTKPETLLKICIGLQLPPLISRILFQKKEYNLLQNTEKNILFNFILDSMYRENIYTIEEIIEQYLEKK